MLTFREVVLQAAAAQGKLRGSITILPLPIAILRLAAAAARLLGLVWRPAGALAGALRFAIYSSTHHSGTLGGLLHYCCCVVAG